MPDHVIAFSTVYIIIIIIIIVVNMMPRVGFGAHVCYHYRISPPHFLAECRKRRLNQGSFVLLFFRLFALSYLYLVFACLFSCTASFVSISQVIGCEDRLRNDLLCVGWGIKLYSLTHLLINTQGAKALQEHVTKFRNDVSD